ncbi:C-C motif chemokine 28 [Spea bombifrons]|uniref:C-C motif chemokine 28 n=1 Tax=Spea bombifrons TaxID=233779 RepID=UPI00234AD825|nr:C-C motif chemokine 28 [Spea bombifrons]
MDLRLVNLLVLAAFFCYLQLSEAFINSKIQCCTEYSDRIPKKVLQRVKSYKIQQANGICNLRAVVLYTRHKTLCMNPKNKHVMRWIKKKNKDQCQKTSTCVGKKKTKRPKKKQKNPKT